MYKLSNGNIIEKLKKAISLAYKMKPKQLEFIGNGGNGAVYYIGDGRAAKFYNRVFPFTPERPFRLPRNISVTALPNAEYEYNLSNRVHEKGISVPRPYGVEELEVPILNHCGEISQKILPAFVMEYIDGISLKDLRESEAKEYLQAVEKRNAELEKARNLGFIPAPDARYEGDDNSKGNALWTLGGIVLLDSANWQIAA